MKFSNPKFVNPNEARRPEHPAISRARLIAKLMDTSFQIPFTKKSFGIDPLMSLIPVWGDVISGILSLYLVAVALQLRLPTRVIVRMLLNIAVDVSVGFFPVVGDLLDAAWKCNQMNFKLLEEAYQRHGVGAQWDAENAAHVIEVLSEPTAS